MKYGATTYWTPGDGFDGKTFRIQQNNADPSLNHFDFKIPDPDLEDPGQHNPDSQLKNKLCFFLLFMSKNLIMLIITFPRNIP